MVRIGNICLPFEILSKIFEMLPQKDQLKLRQVCEEFKRLVNHSYFNEEGFNFVIRDDNGPNFMVMEDMLDELPFNFQYAPLRAIGVFKISSIAFGNLWNYYEREDLKMSHPESLKSLIFGGLMTPMNFSKILTQLTHLTHLTITPLSLLYVDQVHLSGLNFNTLRFIKINCGERFNIYFNTYKIKTFLTENEFPKLKFATITLSFKSRSIHNNKITPEEDFQSREKIFFPFLNKCQKTIETFEFFVIPFLEIDGVIFQLDFSPVEEDENLNLEAYKICCPNLSLFEYAHLKGAKIDPWITFLETNYNNLKDLQWVNKSDEHEDQEAFHNLIKSQKWVKHEALVWQNYSSPYLSEVDFIFLKNYQFLDFLEIRNFPTGIGENWKFKNLKLIPNFCPDLRVLILGRCRMDSDIIDHFLTGNKLPKLRSVKFLSEWRGVGIGMRVDTFRKIIEEKKIEILILMDCIDNDSFGQPDNLEFLISQIGQDDMDEILDLIRDWKETEFSWEKEVEDANNDN